jgi:hypothetical protein
MAAAVIQEPEAPEATRITQVEDLPEPVRADIIARRQAGETLAELKTRFAHVDPTVIREVLPPANARERKAREAKPKANESTQGTGGRSGKAQSNPKSKAEQAPKAPPATRYVEDADLVVNLSERTLAVRQVVGRGSLADALEVTGSAVWRFENGRIHEDEVKGLQAGLKKMEDRIAAGEFVKAAAEPKGKQASKADLTHRIETVVELVKAARGDKGITKAGLVDSLLAVLVPPVQAEEATESE